MNQTTTMTATPVALSSLTYKQLNELHDRLGDEGMDALIRADEARQARQEAEAKETEVKEAEKARRAVLSPRELAAEDLEAQGLEGYAAAVLGDMSPGDGVAVLIAALRDTRVPQKLKAKPNGAIRQAIALALEAQEREADEEKEVIVKEGEDKAKKALVAFAAHAKVGNVGAMSAVLRDLRQAEMQAGLIRHLGGVAERDNHLAWCRREIDLVTKTKVRRKK